MFDPKQLLDQLLGSKVPGTDDTVRGKAGQAVQLAKDNPLATGAIAAVLLGTGTGRSLTGSALKLGGIAAIAGLGYHAYQNYKADKAPDANVDAMEPDLLPAPEDTSFDLDAGSVGNDFALALVRAMIAAARSDGHVDDSERSKIADKLLVAGVESEAQAFIDAELADPTDLSEIIAAAGSEEQRVELYTASRLAINPDSRAERGYLDMLAGRLGLPDGLVDHIEATVAAAGA